MRHTYSLIRFVPDPARGEFINVGALVGCEESSEWGIRQISNAKRARDLGSGSFNALDAVWSFIDRLGGEIDRYQDSLESLFEADADLDEKWLERLYCDHQNIVQLSPPTPMVANSVEEALDRVFDLMILDPARQRYRRRWKNEILAATRRAYREQSIMRSDLYERVVLSTERHNDRFDFAVTNGRTLQLVRSWSFQVSDWQYLSNQIKSWGWTVKATRDSGGSITIRDGRSFDVQNDVDIEVVYIPPEPEQNEAVFREGKSVFEALDVRSVPLQDVSSVAERARSLLVDAGVKLSL